MNVGTITIIVLFSILVTTIGILMGTMLAIKKQLKNLEHYLYMDVMCNQHFD